MILLTKFQNPNFNSLRLVMMNQSVSNQQSTIYNILTSSNRLTYYIEPKGWQKVGA